MLFATSVLVAALAHAASATFGSSVVLPLCKLEGAFAAPNATVASLSTFNVDGPLVAGQKICTALTPASLGATSVDCSVSSAGNKTVLVALVEGTDGTGYECRAEINNVSRCPTKTSDGHGSGGRGDKDDDDDDRKRAIAPLDCSQFRNVVQCTNGCEFGPFSSCRCYWDSGFDPNSFPNDPQSECPVGQPCCFQPPCTNWLEFFDCFVGGGGIGDEFGNIMRESKCLWNAEALTCGCKAPLVPAGVNGQPGGPFPDVFAPYDCICPFGAIDAFPAECAAFVTPTEAQLSTIKGLNQRIGFRAAAVSKFSLIRSCRLKRFRLIFRGKLLKFLVDKYKDAASKAGIIFDLQWLKTGVELTFLWDDASKAKSLSETTFTAEELAEFELQDVTEAEESSATTAVLSATVAAALAVNQL